MGRLHQAAPEYVRRAAARKKAAKAQADRLTSKPPTADLAPTHLRCIVLAAREPHRNRLDRINRSPMLRRSSFSLSDRRLDDPHANFLTEVGGSATSMKRSCH